MKDYTELVSRFDDIQDLSVSEEQLGAYLEGNLSLYEMEEMGNMVNHDPMLQSIIEDASISILGKSNEYEGVIKDSSGNDISDVATYEDDLTSLGNEVHPDIRGDESIIGIDSSHYDYDAYFDDLTFELPDIPFL